MKQAAVIFDVDGPLLELTTAEEDLFFAPLQTQYGLANLSRDWNSYAIRNDVEIYREILHQHLNRPPTTSEITAVSNAYVMALEAGYEAQSLEVVPISGAQRLLEQLSVLPDVALGIATANLGNAARVRLQRANLWPYISGHAGAAEAGGAKSNILTTVLARIDSPGSRTIFLGDNLNDLDAARANDVHFIGFHTNEKRRQRLQDAGAQIVCGDHETTWRLIQSILHDN